MLRSPIGTAGTNIEPIFNCHIFGKEKGGYGRGAAAPTWHLCIVIAHASFSGICNTQHTRHEYIFQVQWPLVPELICL